VFVRTVYSRVIWYTWDPDSVKEVQYYCGRLDFKRIIDKHMVHFFSKIDQMNNDMLCNSVLVISQPSIYIDGWLYGMRMTSVVCNVPVLSQNDSTYHHSVFTT